jgi:hypothetical protein
VIALSDGCELKHSARKDIKLIEISPGMKVSASGRIDPQANKSPLFW